VWNSVVEEVIGNDETRRDGVRVQKSRDTGNTSPSTPTGMFVAIGHTPNTDVSEGPTQTWIPKGFIVLQGSAANGDERRRRLRRRRRGRSDLQTSHHRRRHGLQGRAGRGALAGGEELPKGYDVIIVIKPHETMKLEDYQRILRELCVGC
jgi:hypothetical protein